MLLQVLCLLAAVLACGWALIHEIRRRSGESPNLPPGPKGLPIVGNVFQLGPAPHVSFARMARQHGPLMTIWLGAMRTIVISSEKAAREMFKNNDVALAGRFIYEATRGYPRNDGSMITSQYGPHWRMLRRLSTTEFFVLSRLEAMQSVRTKVVDEMIRTIGRLGEQGTKPVDVGRLLFFMMFNLFGNLMFSKDLLDPKSKIGADFFYHSGKITEITGKPNVADYIPVLKPFDPQGIRRKVDFHVNNVLTLVEAFINERLESGPRDTKKKDFLDVLLEFEGDGEEEPAKFSTRIINIIVLEMFSAGTDTTTSSIEWGLAELIRSPRCLKKVQEEIRRVIGSDGKIEDKDLENLPYLKAVVKETLRLHPPLPFLFPHRAMSSCKMMGYNIPEDSQILVNVWAIGRDPDSWEDPLTFNPERFVELNHIDYKGQHYQFIPFGAGRRICPAMPLASRMVPVALGNLLLHFDWELPDGLKPESMDMSERMGITLRKGVPINVIPIPYNPNNEVFKSPTDQ